MTVTIKDRVQQTTNTTGNSSPFTLDGGVLAFKTFIGASLDTKTCVVCVTDDIDFEISEGVIANGSPATHSRATCLASSNADAPVVWGAGSKRIGLVFCARDINSLIGLAAPVALPGTPHAVFEADAGLGLSDGAAVPTWADQSGNGLDLTAAGSAQPTFLLNPDGDGLPLIRFDGVANALKRTGMTSYTGTDLTLFLVARCIKTGSTACVGSLATTSNDDGSDRLQIRAESIDAMRLRRNGVTYNATVETSGAGGTTIGGGHYDWTILIGRWGSILGRGVLSTRLVNIGSAYDLSASPPPAWAYTIYTLGAGFDGSNPRQWLQCDIRAFGVYHSALRDDQIRDLIRFLGNKWKIPGTI